MSRNHDEPLSVVPLVRHDRVFPSGIPGGLIHGLVGVEGLHALDFKVILTKSIADDVGGIGVSSELAPAAGVQAAFP